MKIDGQFKNDRILAPAAKAASILRDEIRRKKYATGEQLPNECALANRFGISRGTMHKALKMLGVERLIVSQRGRGTFVADPVFGRQLGTNAALIGAMVWETRYYFGAIVQVASLHSAKRGYVLTTGSNATQEEERQHVEAFLRNGIRGIILTPRTAYSQGTCERLRKENLPVVLLDGILPGYDEDFVSVDNRKGTFLAAMHLIELGHRRLAYIGYDTPDDFPCKPERLAGFLDACQQAQVEVPGPWRIDATEQNYRETLVPILQAPGRPTGFVTYNDAWAVRIANLARELNLRIPEDLSVVGFDDSSMSKNDVVPITTVHPEFRQIGMMAVNLLIDKIENPDSRPTMSVLITPRLVIRQSSAKPPTT